MTSSDIPDLVIAVANGDYATLKPLPRAVPETGRLVSLLRGEYGLDPIVLNDLRRGELLIKLEEALTPGAFPGGALIVLWTGHADVVPSGRLRLLGRKQDTADGEVATPGWLGEMATGTGANQVLVILDTCFSGQGIPDAVTTANAVLAGRSDLSTVWFGVVAASRGDEPARSGAMARELTRLLTKGPDDPYLRQRWSIYRARIRGDDLIDALLKEWSEERHSPHQANIGSSWPMLRNPLHRPRAGHAVVEHLLHSARGTSTDENFFTGREAILARISTWIRRRQRGLYIVTGPPASGKSAIVGRIVSLSAPEEREHLAAREEIAADLDPGESCVDVHLHARGLDHKGVVEVLVTELGLEDGTGFYDVLALAARRRAADHPLLVVVDGLDEAGPSECRETAARVIEPLAREALVLIGTREVPGSAGEPGLLALLGTSAGTVDLAQDPEGTLRDVHRYVMRRLADGPDRLDASLVADEIVRSAREADLAHEGPFLLARLVTSQLRANPVNTSDDGWQSRIASTVQAAFENDLRSTVLTVQGQPHPTAARELLHALTYAYGQGMPADDLWPAIATALSPTGTHYTRVDVYNLLTVLGRHVVSGAEGDMAVYRVAHQRLVEHLRPNIGAGVEPGGHVRAARRSIADAVAGLYEEFLDTGQAPRDHTYLWWHAWRHFSDARTHGIDLLRRFVERDRDAFLPDLADAMDRMLPSPFWSEPPEVQVGLAEELVDIRRELDDSLDICTALFDLALALTRAGDLDKADQVASEAVRLARDAVRDAEDDPISSLALCGGLTTQALTHLRQGDPGGAWVLAVEAVTLTEAWIGRRPEMADVLSSSAGIAALAAMRRGQPQDAERYSRRALAALDERQDDEETEAVILLDALQVRATVELVQRTFGNASESDRTAPFPSVVDRILRIYREQGASGTAYDIALAECLRICALISQRRILVEEDTEAPDPIHLLDSALTLVTDFADRREEANLMVSTLLSTRARLTPDRSFALADLEAAEQRLRPVAASSPLGGLALGEVISQITWQCLSDPAADLTMLIERQREAVELLGTSRDQVARDLLIDALRLLAHLLVRAGKPDDAANALQASVEEHREFVERSLAGATVSTLLLASSLADLAGLICAMRPLEAIDFASEALDLLESMDRDTPGVDVLRGLCHTNLGGAYLNMERFGEAHAACDAAISLLENETDSPIACNALAAALNNLSNLRIRSEQYDSALELAQRAVALLAAAGPSSITSLLPLLHVNMGCALKELGRGSESEEWLREGIDALRNQLTTDSGAVLRLAAGLNAAGDAFWDVVLADLTASPAAAVELALRRKRPSEELDLTIAAILEGLKISGDNAELDVTVRVLARDHRAHDRSRFDDLWAQRTGAVPDWLKVDPSLGHAVTAWWNADTEQRARAFMLANMSLLSPDTDILLTEIGTAYENTERAEWLRSIRADAAERGVETAYALILADVLIDDWLNSDDEEAFLLEHLDDLLEPEVADALERDESDEAEVLSDILVLTRRGEPSVAYKVLEEPESGIPLLKAAWRSADPERLVALARLCLWGAAEDHPERHLADVALAIGLALTNNSDQAVPLAASALTEAVDDEERRLLRDAVSDALTHHLDSPDPLITLLRALPI